MFSPSCLFTVIFCLLLKLILAATDCDKLPANEIKIVDCCAFKTPKSDAIEENCEKTKAKCPNECYYNGAQVFTDGKIDLAKVKAIYQAETAAGPEYMPFVEKIHQSCDGKLKENMAKILAKPERNGCKAYPEILSVCLGSEFFINCPASMWKNTPTCNSFREYFKACPITF